MKQKKYTTFMDEEIYDEEILQIMQDNDIDKDTAEKVQELIDEGLDEDEAVELADEF